MTMHVTGPLMIAPGCHVWLAVFSPELNDSLSRQNSELSTASLSSSDFRRWEQYRPLEKKRQFLNSRLAVRSVLKEEFGPAASRIRMETGAGGRPILISSGVRECPEISLSHSDTAVAVAISRCGIPVGVDIEKIEPLKVRSLRFVTANSCEMALYHRQNVLSETEFLRTLWTIKESVWKSLGGPGEITASDITVAYGEDGLLHPRVIDRSNTAEEFSTRLFAVQCKELLPETMVVKPATCHAIGLRGSVSLRIQRAG
jgi:phosphopantetheinyl transferase